MKTQWMVVLWIGVLTIVMGACTSAELSKVESLGHNHHVRLYAASGQVIGEWHTDGITHNEENSDGLYFTDRASGHLVRIAGTFIDEQE